MTTPQPPLSDLQLAVMKAVWSRGEATVAEVHGELAEDRSLAMTTVATLLSRLEKRGLLAHRTQGRQFVYRALVTEDVVRVEHVSRLTDNLFRGDVTELVCHLLADRDMKPGDLERVKAMIRDHETKGGGGPDDRPDARG